MRDIIALTLLVLVLIGLAMAVQIEPYHPETPAREQVNTNTFLAVTDDINGDPFYVLASWQDIESLFDPAYSRFALAAVRITDAGPETVGETTKSVLLKIAGALNSVRTSKDLPMLAWDKGLYLGAKVALKNTDLNYQIGTYVLIFLFK